MENIIPLGILLGVIACGITIYLELKRPGVISSTTEDLYPEKNPLFENSNRINHTECEYTIGPFARHDPNYSPWIGEDD